MTNTQLVDLSGAKAFIEANWPNDPLLRHIGITLLDKLPKVEVEQGEQRYTACGMCNNAHTDPELRSDNDLSYTSIGESIDEMRMMLRSGDGRPTEIIVEGRLSKNGFGKMGYYRPNYCPNCGRELIENRGTENGIRCD